MDDPDHLSFRGTFRLASEPRGVARSAALAAAEMVLVGPPCLYCCMQQQLHLHTCIAAFAGWVNTCCAQPKDDCLAYVAYEPVTQQTHGSLPNFMHLHYSMHQCAHVRVNIYIHISYMSPSTRVVHVASHNLDHDIMLPFVPATCHQCFFSGMASM